MGADKTNAEQAASTSPRRRKWTARDWLCLAGYAYSVGLFLFACALALSLNGIAFSPLHLKVKATLAFLKIPAAAGAPATKDK